MFKRLQWQLLAVLICLGGFSQAQHLQRQGSFGFRPMLVTDSIATAHQLKEAQGMLLLAINPGGTFETLKAQESDILLAVNGQEMKVWPDLIAARGLLRAGDPISAKVWRKGKAVTLKGKVVGIPQEASTDRYEVIYGEAPFEDGYLRTIVNRPRKPGPHPTIYFIPGYTCASVDIVNPIHPYRKLFDSLCGLDYLIYRIEKPGVGDGPNPCRCQDTGFDKEMTVFEAGYDQLLKTEGVDKENIFIFGHSMGGIEAPLLAAQSRYQPAGIAVYGTVFQSWYEYILNMLRFQQPRLGDDYLELELKIQEYTKLFYEHYVLHKPLKEIIANPEWKAMLEKDFALNEDGDILGRRAFFWGEIAKLNLTKAWAETEAHVLSIYGEADFEVFNAFSMEEIVRIVNTYHPGKGTFKTLPGTDHSFIYVGSMEMEAKLKGSPAYREYLVNHFDYQIVSVLHDWIQEVMRQRS